MARFSQPQKALILLMAFVLLLAYPLVVTVCAGNGDAEVSRYKNFQFFEMTPGSSHPPGNASVTRYKNLQFFEMMPSSGHPPGNASVTRYRNFQFFEMTPGSSHPPGNASVTRYKNLQFFEMTLTQPLTATIDSFVTMDWDGNPKNTFLQGSNILFKAAVSGSQTNIPNALISIMVKDPGQTPIFLSFTYEDIEVGKQKTLQLGFKLPDNSMLGDFVAKITIFSRLPSQGGQAITFAEVHFTIS